MSHIHKTPEPSTGSLSRRTAFLRATTLVLGATLGYPSRGSEPDPIRLMSWKLEVDPVDGRSIRRFAGRAAPTEILTDPETGVRVRIRDLFPGRAAPFPIDDRLQLGDGGWGLRCVDRAGMGLSPSHDNAAWAMNMIPFGVLLDGSIIDPSGPWYDGGAADPRNPFDRSCTGWEYEVMHPAVSAVVGIPAAIPGHVQPSGMFHYHGYPALLVAALRDHARATGRHGGPLLLGFSADGFPILDHRWRESRDGHRHFRFSSYVLRDGPREALPLTNPERPPPGAFDGLFVQDYAFDPQRKRARIEAALERGETYCGLTARDMRLGRASYALLDRYNGGFFRELEGYGGDVWGYALTPDWPMIPRLFAFEPDISFRNIIPFEARRSAALGRISRALGLNPGRRALYDNCPASLQDMRAWHGRPRY